MVIKPQKKAEALARYFATKLSADGRAMRTGENPVRTAIRARYAGGFWPLGPAITPNEVHLAVKDLPLTKAPGPEKVPAEFYSRLPALLKIMPELYTSMMQTNRIPKEAAEYHILPFDKYGKDPSLCSSK